MPPPTPADKRTSVLVSLTNALPPSHIAKNQNLCVRTVQRIRRNIIKYGTTRRPKEGPQGHP